MSKECIHFFGPLCRYHAQNYCCVEYDHRAVFRYTKNNTVSATGFAPVFRKNVGEIHSLASQNYSQDLEMPSEVCITPEFRYSTYSSQDAAACRLVNGYGPFEGQWCLHLRSTPYLPPKMKALRCFAGKYFTVSLTSIEDEPSNFSIFKHWPVDNVRELNVSRLPCVL